MKAKMARPLLLIAVMALVACLGSDPIVFVSPTAGSDVKTTAFKAEVKVPVDAGSIAVKVNGKLVAVGEYLVDSPESPDGTTVVSGSLGKSYFSVGINTIELSATDLSGKAHSKSVEFKYLGEEGDEDSLPEVDKTDPLVKLTSPTRGAFHKIDSVVTVTGTATDDSTLVKLTAYLDGIAYDKTASLVDGAYSFEVKVTKGGLHSIKVEAFDSFGNMGRHKVSFFGGVAKPTGSMVPHALGVSVSKSGLDLVASLIEDALAPEKVDLTSRLASANPIWKGKKLFVKAELHVLSAGYSKIDLAFDTFDGGLELVSDIHDVHVAMKAKIKIGFKFTMKGSIKARKAHFLGRVKAAKTAEGKLAFAMPTAKVKLAGFSFDIKKFPGALESLAKGFVRRFLEKKLSELIREKAAPILSEKLGELTVAKELVVLGHPIKVTGSLATVEFLLEGGNFSMDGAIEATKADPFHEPLGGFLYTHNPTAPPVSLGVGDFFLAVSDDTINQAFYEAYRAGALKFEFTKTVKLKGIVKDLTVGFLEAYLGAGFLASHGLGAETPIKLTFDAGLPPVISLRKGAKGLAVVSAHDLELSIYAGDIKLFTFELDADLPIGMTVTAMSKLKPVLFPDDTKLDFRITEEPVVNVDNKLIEPLINDLAKLALPFLTKGIDGLPLPSIASLKLTSVTLDTKDGYLLVSAGLTR